MRGRTDKIRRTAIAARSAMAALVLLALGAVCASIVAAEDSPQVLEQKVKAAFLFKFGGYVEWPDSVFPARMLHWSSA